jgi:hypothetical protein
MHCDQDRKGEGLLRTVVTALSGTQQTPKKRFNVCPIKGHSPVINAVASAMVQKGPGTTALVRHFSQRRGRAKISLVSGKTELFVECHLTKRYALGL